MYVGLVGAYGSLNLVPAWLSSQTLSRSLTGLLTASALLHFYYDGFIWKVREASTRESLGLRTSEQTPGAVDARRMGPAPWVHGLKWAAFIAPMAWFGFAETRGAIQTIERDRLVVQAVPRSAEARNNLGGALLVQGQIDEAIEQLGEAMRLDPAHAEAHSNLGVALARRGQWGEAIEQYKEALSLDPRQTQAYSNLGNALLQQGRIHEAIAQFDAGLAIEPHDAQARTNRAGALLRDGRRDEAIADLEEVLRATPDFLPARRNLEIIRGQQRGR